MINPDWLNEIAAMSVQDINNKLLTLRPNEQVVYARKILNASTRAYPFEMLEIAARLYVEGKVHLTQRMVGDPNRTEPRMVEYIATGATMPQKPRPGWRLFKPTLGDLENLLA